MATNADEAQTSIIQNVIDKFIEENPGVSVEYVSYGKDYENPVNYVTFTVKSDGSVRIDGKKEVKVSVNL